MSQRQLKLKRWVRLTSLLVLSALMLGSASCVTLGGTKREDRLLLINITTKNQRSTEICIILKCPKVDLMYKTEETVYVDKDVDITNWSAIRPDVAIAKGLTAPRVAESRIAQVMLEDGRQDKLNIAGWYVVPEGQATGL